MEYIIPLFFIVYFVQSVFHFILIYKIMKSENVINNFGDFMFSSKEIYVLMYQIFLKKRKLNNVALGNVFKLNFFIAMILFVLILIFIVKQIK